MDQNAKRRIAVRFLTSDQGGRRSGIPDLSSGQYRPHLVVGIVAAGNVQSELANHGLQQT